MSYDFTEELILMDAAAGATISELAQNYNRSEEEIVYILASD